MVIVYIVNPLIVILLYVLKTLVLIKLQSMVCILHLLKDYDAYIPYLCIHILIRRSERNIVYYNSNIIF